MKVLIIGTYLEIELIEKFNKVSKSNSKISIAAVKYSNLISKGFRENIGEDSKHLFLAPIGTFPNCKKIVWAQGKINNINYIKFINIILIKQITISLYVLLYILKWSFKYRNEDRIVVFTFLYLPFLFSMIPLKVFTKVKYVSFIPDMPSYEFSYSDNDGYFKKKLIPTYVFLANKLISLLDYYVFITKYMRDIFPKKPFSVMEGLVDINNVNETLENQKEVKNAVMYSGALFEKFGVVKLLNSFSKIKGDYEIWFFGSGDAVPAIKAQSLEDSRIKYFGSLPNEQILEYQKKALLLVNPRFSSEEYTKYSFPSKLMEYLSSGTPTLTTRLPGIPDDYLNKFYFIENEDYDGFRHALEFCLNKDKEELYSFGQKGKEFVVNEKNYKKQVASIVRNLQKFIKEK
ncbi:glycosyltransferase [Kaistella antarctica]|uniref:Glycosyl transferases group 1 n=1 Tax=Kaistella antarctica TaxID=266748 RepID=A0A448NRC2_9FLAO|nr:glycosyltransferase [Kaistella antarctica]SEW15016.1 Glycosyltransferase involved in cell wall bisynthesis [Kaistella antarctica]VEH99426.1 Glycosyl transferases group 1 [Kaistella antarctica]